jgi:fatty-acyl-CoA synthase
MKLINDTIGAILERNTKQWPDREAAVFYESNIRFTWKELNERVNEIAKSLLSIGVRRKDHVAIWATNVPEWYLTQLATARIGAALVTINPEWKHSELEYALAQSDSNVLIMIPGFSKVVRSKSFYYDYVGMFRELCPELPCKQRFPMLREVIVATNEPMKGYLNWPQFLSKGKNISDATLAEAAKMVESEDTAMIQYTSGTTGFPKGSMLTHFNVVNDALIVGNNMKLSVEDKVCGPVPFYHCFGSILFNLGCLMSGAATVVPSQIFNSRMTLEAVNQERCTGIYGVPTMFIAEFEEKDFEKYDLSCLRTGIMAGAPVDKELFEVVTRKMGVSEMTIAYGLTEASPVTHQTLPSDPPDKRFSTVGRPLPFTESRIVDPATFKTLPKGEVGEIWVRGFNIMKGYYKKPEETAQSIVEDGWLRTGDLGDMDHEGFYRIVGRLKEMLIVGGHNVYPAEVEQALHTILKDKVEIAQVVAVPHPKLQEVVGLAVKCHPGETITLEEIQQRCDGKLEWSKIPRHLMVLEDFSKAMTVTGKIQKFKLAKMFKEQLSLAVH